MLTPATLKFQDDLKKNNNRDWFQANQDRYELYKKDYRETIEEFLEEIKPLDDTLEQLEFKDCSYRINRDIRFTKDKTPYKNHLGIWICEGKKKTNLAGYYIHVEKGASFAAGGLYFPDAADLKKVRREIDGFYEELETIVAEDSFKKIFGKLESTEENTLKTSPKDFDKNHPAIEFLKFKSFMASFPISDKELTGKNFVKDTTKKIMAIKPLIEFLNRALTTE
jgi:uncharacterized protein (TIGR02453 family)